MDNAMVKRGIGAVVLAVIAALLLGYLLKGKSTERKQVTEIALPNAPEMNIPSLTDAIDSVSDGAATLVENTKDTVVNAGDSVVAAVSNTVDTVSDQTSTEKPGFSIRPSQNENKEIVDNTQGVNVADNASTTANNNAPSNSDVVVASTTAVKKKAKESFKPVIVKPKKKVIKKVVAKKPTKPVAPTAPKAPMASSPSGKYSIQLLATSSESRAQKLAKVMNSEGYQSFITQTTRDNKLLYRVRIGAHSDRNGAIKAQEGMKRRYQKNFFVQNSLVISN